MSTTDEMILVPRAELLAWAKAWLDDYGPDDGTDCVTPFDTYLLKTPVEANCTCLSAPVGVPEGWPKANEEDASRGWTIDYGFLDRVTDIAKSRTYYTTSAEASEQVLIAALEVLATTPRSKRHDR